MLLPTLGKIRPTEHGHAAFSDCSKSLTKTQNQPESLIMKRAFSSLISP